MYIGPIWFCHNRECMASYTLWEEEDSAALGNYIDEKGNYVNVPCPECGKELDWMNIDPDAGII